MSHKTLVNFILSFLHGNATLPSSSEDTGSWTFLQLINNNNYSFTIDSLSSVGVGVGDDKEDGPSYQLFNYYVFICTIWCLCSLTPSSSTKLSFIHLLKCVMEMFILNTTLVICLPAILIFNGSISLIRLCIRIHLKMFHRGKIILMNSPDAFWSLEEYAQSCNFNVMFVIQGDCNLQKVRDKFSRLMENPVYDKMRRVVIQKFGFFCWKKMERVDVSQHVRFWSKYRMTESQVFDKMREFSDQIFKQDKPPWEVLVIPKYSYDNYDREEGGQDHYAIIFRMHHALMDGISAGQAIRNEIADLNPQNEKVALSVDPCAKINVNIWHKVGIYLLLATIGVRSIIRSLTFSEPNCFHTGKYLAGPKNIGWTRRIDLQRLKELKIKTRTTTTTILLNAFICALKNIADKKKLLFPTRICAAPTVAVLPYPDSKPQNRFILAHVKINAEGSQTRVQRLRNVHAAVTKLANSPDVMMNNIMLWLVGRWPVLVQRVFFKLVHATVLISNVPGFKEPTTVFGGKLVDAVGWTPVKGTTGIGICLFSYNGQLRASIIADKVSLATKTDVKDFISEFENEVEKLTRDTDSSTCFTLPH